MDSAEVTKVLREFFVEREGAGILEVIEDIDFVEEGIIDSIDLVTLAAFIEEKLGKRIDPTDCDTLDAVRRFGTLVALVTD
jgi:acyl carrier protein